MLLLVVLTFHLVSDRRSFFQAVKCITLYIQIQSVDLIISCFEQYRLANKTEIKKYCWLLIWLCQIIQSLALIKPGLINLTPGRCVTLDSQTEISTVASKSSGKYLSIWTWRRACQADTSLYWSADREVQTSMYKSLLWTVKCVKYYMWVRGNQPHVLWPIVAEWQRERYNFYTRITSWHISLYWDKSNSLLKTHL